MKKNILKSDNKKGSYWKYDVTSGNVESGVKLFLKRGDSLPIIDMNQHAKFGVNPKSGLGCRLSDRKKKKKKKKN